MIAREVFPPGSCVKIEIEGWPSGVLLTGRVVWSRRIPPHLSPAFGGGMGVRLAEAGNAEYQNLLTPHNR